MRIAFTVKEVCETTYTRYKYYTTPETMTLFPSEWKEWSVDEKYTWVNNNCHFNDDHAEEIDSEIVEEVATEMEVIE